MDERGQGVHIRDQRAQAGLFDRITRGFTMQNISEGMVWHEQLKRGFNELAIGGAGSFTMHQLGRYTANMNVEPVVATTR